MSACAATRRSRIERAVCVAQRPRFDHQAGRLRAHVHLTRAFLRGGEALYRRTGRYYDQVRGETCSELALEFLRSHGLQMSFNMDIDQYGADDAKTQDAIEA